MIKAKRGGKLSGGEGFRRFAEADGSDTLFGFIGKNLLLFIVIIAAVLTTLFAPIARFPANDNIAKTGIIFAFLIASAGLQKGNAEKLLINVFGRIPEKYSRTVPLCIILTAFLLGAVFTPVGSVILAVPAATVFYKLWHKTALIFSLMLTASALGSFLIPSYIGRYVLRAGRLSYGDYLLQMLPLAAIGLLLCLVTAVIFCKPDTVSPTVEKKPYDIFTIAIYSLIFVLVVLSSFGVINIIISFCSAVLAAVILDSDNLRKVDYGLLIIVFLLTVTAWNILRTDMVPLPNSPFFASVVMSSLVGASDATLLLFPKNVPALLLLTGTNIGALGLLTASAAGIFVYRRYLDTSGAKPILGLLIFTGVGILTVIILSLFTAI
ncbi:MAG: hypothetical protein LBL80_05000 [Ruminococcus sp.]|jgi:hypothetical protein|nr:hypothetical protein [Ruminococcus sp.]